MTAQAPELLYYKGKRYNMIVEPLEAYYENKPPRPEEFVGYCTANWRGYIGTWRIRYGQLYLSKLESFEGVEFPLGRYFPDTGKRVLADWFTGELICPYGEMLSYVHMGYASIYEKYLCVDVMSGNVQGVDQRSYEDLIDSMRG